MKSGSLFLKPGAPRTWVAAGAFGAVVPLLGYAYAGRLARGFVAVGIGVLFAWGVSNAPFGIAEIWPFAIFAFAAKSFVSVAWAVDAALLVRGGRSRMGVPDQSPLVYAGLVASSLAAMVVYASYSEGRLPFVRQVCESAMRVQPTIWPGECVLAAPKSQWARGDIVLLQGERRLEYSRVLGLAGDRVALDDGTPVVNGSRFAQTPMDVPLEASMFRPEARDPRREVNADGRAYDVINVVMRGEMRRTEPEFVVAEGRLAVLSDTRGWIDGKRLLREVPLADAVGTPVMISRSPNDGRLGTLVR